MKPIIGLQLILLIFFSHQAFGAGWEDYKANKISQMIIDYTESSKSLDFFLTAGIPFRTTVRYLGKTRKTEPGRLIFIEMWAKSHGMNPDTVQAFSQEILIEEDGNKYWLPIQQVLIPYLNKEVETNSSVVLFLVLAGATKTDWVFLVNEFNLL